MGRFLNCPLKAGSILVACVGLLCGCQRAAPPAPADPSPAAVDLRVLRPAAEAGDAKAQQALGDAYLNGRGVPADYKEAAKWLAKAAEQGNSPAQYGLGQLYEAGQGVSQSYEQALAFYRKAADQGHAEAQYALAVLYAFGRGTAMNDAEAARWYLKAAEQGEPLAQFNIGQRYQAGRGVPVDLVEAYKWLSLAAVHLPDSAVTRDELKRQLTRPQLAEAKQRAEAFTAGKSLP
jgi:TPR repeat protein